MALVSLAALVAAVRADRVASFPTDTVPALAVTPACGAAIFHLKQRPPDKPLILMAATPALLWRFVAAPSDRVACGWERVAARVWPGACTLVLPANSRGQALNPGAATIGLRVPAASAAIAVLQQTGPLLTTSANRSGDSPQQTMAAIAAAFPSVACYGEGDATASLGSGLPSTVVAWRDGQWEVLRQGAVAWNEFAGGEP